MVKPPTFLVYVVKIGEPDYAQYTEPFIRAYCRRHGYPLVFGSMQVDDQRHPSWQKLMVHRFIEADFILVMDLDIAPLPHAPAITPHLDLTKLNLAHGYPSRMMRKRLARRGVETAHMVWSCGLIGFPRSLAPVLENVYRQADLEREAYWEQGAVCTAVHDRGLDVHVIDQMWNWCPNRKPFDPSRQDIHFAHFAGNKRWRIRNAVAVHEHVFEHNRSSSC